MDTDDAPIKTLPCRLRKVSSLKFPPSPVSNAASPTFSDDGSGDIPRYTSLRDLRDANGNGYFGRNGSDIGLRTRFLKHCASEYVPSDGEGLAAAAAGAGRHQSCFASFRDKMSRNKAALFSCWRAYVRDPIMACFRPIILRLFSLVHW